MTGFIVVFGVTLLLAVLTSAVAARSPLSTTAVFLIAGLVAGPLGLDVLHPGDATVATAAEVALFVILFTDGQHSPLPVVRRHWGTPTRALLVAMPLSFVVVALLGRVALGLDWLPALVLGAVLAPTDPVFASALVGRDDVPRTLQQTLNIESGVNDGLALPAVLILVGTLGADPEGFTTEPLLLLGELALGVVLGAVLPLLVGLVLKLPSLGSEPRLLPLGPLASAILLYQACHFFHANEYVAAFVAGSVMATLRPDTAESFGPAGDLLTELTKGGAVILFAALLTPDLLGGLGTLGWLVAFAVPLAVRPVTFLISMWRSPLPRDERLAGAWFGPKGFASVAYAILVWHSGIPQATEVFTVAAATVLVSVILHSSTDTAVARRLQA